MCASWLISLVTDGLAITFSAVENDGVGGAKGTFISFLGITLFSEWTCSTSFFFSTELSFSLLAGGGVVVEETILSSLLFSVSVLSAVFSEDWVDELLLSPPSEGGIGTIPSSL